MIDRPYSQDLWYHSRWCCIAVDNKDKVQHNSAYLENLLSYKITHI